VSGAGCLGASPFRTCVVKHTVYVLELSAGAICSSRAEAGDQIQVRTTSSDTPSLQAPASEKVQAHLR
jgi:hypothetical protein